MPEVGIIDTRSLFEVDQRVEGPELVDPLACLRLTHYTISMLLACIGVPIPVTHDVMPLVVRPFTACCIVTVLCPCHRYMNMHCHADQTTVRSLLQTPNAAWIK